MRRLSDAELVRAFMKALHERANVAARVYFTGGATAVLMGWRPTTLDIDLRWEPEHDELRRLFEAIEPGLYRFPAIDPSAFRRAVDEAIARVR